MAEALGLVNEVDQSLLGARRRTGVWRVEEEQEEDDALRLQDQLTQQGHQVTKRCPLAGRLNLFPGAKRAAWGYEPEPAEAEAAAVGRRGA